MLVSFHGFCADWKPISYTEKPSISATYIDSGQYKYKPSGSTVEMWSKTVKFDDKIGWYKISSELSLYSCNSKKYQVLYTILYDADGNVTYSSKGNNSYDFVVPDTLGDSKWNVACTTKGKGFYLPKVYIPDWKTAEEMKSLGYQPEYVPEDLMKQR